ncbi:MAG TPA: hypothetical protein VIW80_09255 [Pyrinomonadaceae bacterium]|jgi:pimeloyl-ACP methyl ester carboxylesterase
MLSSKAPTASQPFFQRLGILLSLSVLLTLTVITVPAQGDRQQSTTKVGAPTANIGTRSSPFPPPKENDITFVTDDGATLDTACRYNSSGPITFEIKITRYVGPVNADGTLQNVDQLISNNVISPTATLLMPAYDVDYSAQSNPERDRVSFNGNDLGFLTGVDNTWKMNSFEIPVRLLKFPARAANGSAPTPAINTVRIDIDVNNGGWCTAIDWGTNTFKALSPIILIHGNNQSGAFFERRGFVGVLQSHKMPYDNSINLPVTTVAANGLALNDPVKGIPGIVKSFGVDSVHLVVHSKGGLDSREYLASYQPGNESRFTILSYTSLSTPHNGSAGADVLMARDDALKLVAEIGAVEFKDFPSFIEKLAESLKSDDGTPNLTTAFVAGFNNRNLGRLPNNTVFNTIAADADTNNNDSIDRSFPDEYEALRAENAALAAKDNPFLGPLNKSRVAVNILYQTLRDTRAVTVSDPINRCNIFGRNCKTVVTIQSLPNETPLGNDTLVTIPSGHGVGSLASRVNHSMTFSGSGGRNHSNVADGGVAETVIPWIVDVEKTRGDLR